MRIKQLLFLLNKLQKKKFKKKNQSFNKSDLKINISTTKVNFRRKQKTKKKLNKILYKQFD